MPQGHVLDCRALPGLHLGDVRVVLVRPSRPANVAAACRAVKNMGLRQVRTVVDQPLVFRAEDRGLAYGAWDVLDAIEPRTSLREATADCALVVGTSGRDIRGSWTPRRMAEEAGRLEPGAGIALVFGPESSGLGNDELGLCHATVHVPTDPAQPSLNLAQAVLLLAYELRLHALEAGPPSGPGAASRRVEADQPTEPPPSAAAGEGSATAGEQEDALDDLRRALLAIGYLNPDAPEPILSELRRLLARAHPSRREAVLLRGMARQILWAARSVAKGAPGGG